MQLETESLTTEAPARVRAGGILLAAVFLLSASGLLFELTLTRIFSATIWYHYAFVAISVALFGWGLGGFLVYILRLSRYEKQLDRIIPALAMLPALLMPLFLATILQLPFTPDRLVLYFALSLLPFLAGGATLSLVFEAHGADSNRLYFADLIGAACGVALVPLIIRTFGAETAVLAIAVLPAIAAVLLALTHGRRRPVLGAASILVLLLAIGLTAWNYRTESLAIRDAPGKGLYQLLAANPNARILSDRWNAYSRITAVSHPPEGALSRLFIDSDAWTNVMRWDGQPESMAAGRDWFRAFAFRSVSQPHVMVIGPGGGTDVVLAIAAGARQVTGVEMNPLIVHCVREFGAQAGNLYDHSKFKLVMQEGRNFIERTDARFDIIMLGFVDSFAAVSSGGLSLTENYLYTRDALEAYYNHLTDAGSLVIIRWPGDVPRLVANAYSFLTQRGMSAEEAGRHILAVSSREPRADEPVETVFMLSRSPMSREQVDRYLAGHADVYLHHSPDGRGLEQYQKLFNGGYTLAEYSQAFDKLATPVFDDRPFYFATDKPFGMPRFVMRLFSIPVAAVLLFTVLLLAGGRVVGFQPPSGRTVTYFGALGIGFIVCEIALMQRLILLLGHPIYTLVVILFAILLASSLGSLYARRFAPEDIHARLGRILLLVVLLIALGAVLLPGIVRLALPLALPVRIALAGAIAVPFGFLMGMPFPLGLRRLATTPGATPVSALWGINGVASVVGSISAVVLAVIGGFTWVFVAAGICYVAAWYTRPQ